MFFSLLQWGELASRAWAYRLWNDLDIMYNIYQRPEQLPRHRLWLLALPPQAPGRSHLEECDREDVALHLLLPQSLGAGPHGSGLAERQLEHDRTLRTDARLWGFTVGAAPSRLRKQQSGEEAVGAAAGMQVAWMRGFHPKCQRRGSELHGAWERDSCPSVCLQTSWSNGHLPSLPGRQSPAGCLSETDGLLPRDKDPSWEALVLIHRTPGLDRWAAKTLAQSLFIPETSRRVVWSNERWTEFRTKVTMDQIPYY